MVATKKYSRQQAISLSGSTSNRLSYLDRAGLVKPEKIGDTGARKPVVLYTESQIDQIKLINQAVRFLHLDGLRLAIKRDRLADVVRSLSELLEDK